MNNKFPSELLQEAAQGNFKRVNVIISEMSELDDNTAAKVIIECCRIFCKQDASTDEETNLYQLLMTCKQFIKQLKDDLFLGYLHSLFFIVKFFLTQKKFEFVLGMKGLLVPEFMDCLKNTKLVKSYNNLCNLIHNAIVDLLRSETSHKNGQVFCQLCMLSLQMKSMHLSTNIILANTATSYFQSPIFFEADIDSQYNCYLAVLQLLKTSTDTETNRSLSDVYSAIIKILRIAIRNLFKQNEFGKIRKYIEATSLAAEKLCFTKIYLKLFNILYHSSQLVIKLEDIPDSTTFSRNNFETYLRDIKCFTENSSFTAEFDELFKLLHLIFYNVLEYYASLSPAIWSTYMDEDSQIGLCNFLGSTGQIISQIKGECHFCSSCKVKNNLYSALKVTALAGNLLQISLNKQASVSKSICSYVLRYLENCCKLIKKLHSQECLQWKSAWSEVGVTIYNTATKLYSLKHDDCCNYFVLLIKTFIYLEGITKSSVFKLDILGTSFQCLSEMNIKSCHFEKALLHAAIGILLASEPTGVYKTWVSAKARSKNSGIEENCDLQQLTVVCVLEQNKNEIDHLYPDLNLKLDAIVTTNLLINELAQYKIMWRSKIPMLAAFRKLCDVADLSTLVKIIIQTWGENLDSVHNDIIKLLNKITSKFELETEKNMENKESYQEKEEQLYLASLYTMQYYAQTRIVRQKTVDDINNTAVPEQFPLPPHEVPKNPNDECDLVSSYVSLQLDEHLKIMKLLSKALSLFNICVSDCTLPIIIERLKEHNMFNFVVKIAYEFRLHCDSLQTIQAWFLCLKISRLVNNNLYILESISFLLEVTNMDSEIINELLTEAEYLENVLTELASCEVWAVLTTYHINKSIMLLRHQNVQAGFKEYEKASECYLKVEGDRDELLKIRLDFLHMRYLQLPCDLQIEGHSVFSLAKCSDVLSRINSYIKVSGNSSFAIVVLFEVYQAVAHMYRWMCLPREVRCYCRDVVTIAQELVIPFQTAYFLTYLAHADLLSTRLDDCQVKLNGLLGILCLDNQRNNPSYTGISDSITITKKDIDVSNLVENFAEIMLDCPSTEYKYKGSSGSPVLLIKPLMLPSFTKHSVDCDCFYCVNVEYKTLVLDYINLEAQLHIFRGNTAAAEACFNSGLQLYKNINKDDSFETKITKYLSCYPLHNWKDISCQTVAALLLNYTNSLLRTNDVKKAELFNQKILNLVSKRKYENFHIYNEALLQKYAIVMSMYEDKGDIQNYLQVNTELLNTKDINDMPKTPENKQTKMIITCHSPRPNSPPKRRLRRIKCDFSDKMSENNDNLKPDELSDDIENIENSKGAMKNTCKTPAPTCSTTYIPSTIKTVNIHKSVMQEIFTPLPKSRVFNDTNTNCCADQNMSSIIPSSPNAYTPNALKVSSVLQSRTKLLTKRLKKSAITKVLKIDFDNNAHEGNASSNYKADNDQVKDNVRKNLMTELCAAETNISVKPYYKKKTRNYISGANATNERTDRVNTRRTTRAASKTANK